MREQSHDRKLVNGFNNRVAFDLQFIVISHSWRHRDSVNVFRQKIRAVFVPSRIDKESRDFNGCFFSIDFFVGFVQPRNYGFL
ncbi:hypothetical protein D3C80_1828920 [compost metagenome]